MELDAKITGQITEVDAVEVGQTIYHVHALGQRSYLSTLFVVKAPHYVGDSKSKFITVATAHSSFYQGKGIETFMSDVSLLDMNVQPNKYNFHKAFSTKGSAVAYLNFCKVLNVDSMKNWGRIYT